MKLIKSVKAEFVCGNSTEFPIVVEDNNGVFNYTTYIAVTECAKCNKEKK